MAVLCLEKNYNIKNQCWVTLLWNLFRFQLMFTVYIIKNNFLLRFVYPNDIHLT